MSRNLFLLVIIFFATIRTNAQINTDQVLQIGQNAMYFEDYVLSIQYFNQVIAAKPYLAQPYFFRAIAKYNLDDFKGAENDATMAIERNPFITDAYEVRGVARQNLGRDSLAIEDYRHALTLLPENKGILYNMAMAQESIKDYDNAEKSFERLLKSHPGFDGGYIGRAKMRLEKKDTLGASADIDKALELNKNNVNGYLLRADIAINRNKDYKQALSDMDEAIRLQPKFAGYFINRAFIRYRLDDYFGAMSDYDYALQLDPSNFVALYNRALLRMEVHDYNKAIDDFSQVLKMRPQEYRALYNRAILYREIGDMQNALKDIDRVIEAIPNFALAYYLRFDIKHSLGMRGAQTDLDKSIAMAKKQKAKEGLENLINPSRLLDKATPAEGTVNPDSEELVAQQFSTLLTVSDNASMEQEYNNKSIRGKVQDHSSTIELEPMFTVTYYTSPTELKPTGDYLREVDDLNRTNALRYVLQVTNHEYALTDADEINRHFQSIEYYNSYLSTHTPRAIDYFGRAMDQLTLRNYPAAIADLDKAIAVAPDFTVAYFMRAIARRCQLRGHSDTSSSGSSYTSELGVATQKVELQKVMDDIDKVIELSPSMAIAYYNKGVLFAEMRDFTSALRSFNKAIELKPNFGEAYYNRGFVYFQLGNRQAGSADLSKAGELGIVPSYNLLKRMSR